jgi:hypothetical protein
MIWSEARQLSTAGHTRAVCRQPYHGGEETCSANPADVLPIQSFSSWACCAAWMLLAQGRTHSSCDDAGCCDQCVRPLETLQNTQSERNKACAPHVSGQPDIHREGRRVETLPSPDVSITVTTHEMAQRAVCVIVL